MNNKTKLLLTAAYGTVMLMSNSTTKPMSKDKEEFNPVDSENNPFYEFNRTGSKTIVNQKEEKNYTSTFLPLFAIGRFDMIPNDQKDKIITYKL